MRLPDPAMPVATRCYEIRSFHNYKVRAVLSDYGYQSVIPRGITGRHYRDAAWTGMSPWRNIAQNHPLPLLPHQYSN